MDHWQNVFKKLLSQSDRAYVSELKLASPLMSLRRALR